MASTLQERISCETEFTKLRIKNIGIRAKKIISKYFFLVPDESESFPHMVEKIIVAAAFAADNTPISVTVAPKLRASKVERTVDEPVAMFEGIIAKYHGVFDFSAIGGSIALLQLLKSISVTPKVTSKLRYLAVFSEIYGEDH